MRLGEKNKLTKRKKKTWENVNPQRQGCKKCEEWEWVKEPSRCSVG